MALHLIERGEAFFINILITTLVSIRIMAKPYSAMPMCLEFATCNRRTSKRIIAEWWVERT